MCAEKVEIGLLGGSGGFTLDDLFESEAKKRATESDAYLARPEVVARETRRRAQRDAQIELEIAAGLRDADGDPIDTEDEDEEIEETE